MSRPSIFWTTGGATGVTNVANENLAQRRDNILQLSCQNVWSSRDIGIWSINDCRWKYTLFESEP